MGELTANKAKAFYMRMRKELIIIKGNYEASGNGFGSAPSEGSSNDFVGDDRKDFLSVYSPAILYLWQKSEEHAFVGNITQQLSTEVGIDTGIKRSKQKKSEEDESKVQFKLIKNSLEMSTKEAKASNNLKRIELDEKLEDKLYELRREKRKLKQEMKDTLLSPDEKNELQEDVNLISARILKLGKQIHSLSDDKE